MRRCRRAFRLLIVGTALSAVLALAADVVDASPKDVEWFVGKWAVGAADMPGYTTAFGAPDCTKAVVEIVRVGKSTIRRIRVVNGQPSQADFDVKYFNGNFPWWVSGDIGGPIARRTGEDVFLLATSRNGRADWDNALQHSRCK
jgi:hypothetical protein